MLVKVIVVSDYVPKVTHLYISLYSDKQPTLHYNLPCDLGVKLITLGTK